MENTKKVSVEDTVGETKPLPDRDAGPAEGSRAKAAPPPAYLLWAALFECE